MHLFFTPDIESDIYQLSEEESKHCVRVLRLENNDTVFLIDGKGGFYETVIINNHPKQCLLKVVNKQTNYGSRPFKLHIAIAPTKNIERIEWFLEKTSEIGIDEITPIICKNSERKDVKVERLNKIIVSAIKQSLKAFVPKLNEPVNYADFIKKASADVKLIAHCENTERKTISEVIQKGQDVLVLIGPEGDFTTSEIEIAKANGFNPVILGSSRLRTETAGVVACTITNLINNV